MLKVLLYKKEDGVEEDGSDIEEIEMKEFIKIFERDQFGDKAAHLIKQRATEV